MLGQENLILYVLLAFVVFMLLSKKSKCETFGDDEQLGSTHKFDTNMCSPDCCGSQWPVSFPMKTDDRVSVEDVGDKYIPTNMTCTGLRGRGCLCANKEQYEFLRTRGNNS